MTKKKKNNARTAKLKKKKVAVSSNPDINAKTHTQSKQSASKKKAVLTQEAKKENSQVSKSSPAGEENKNNKPAVGPVLSVFISLAVIAGFAWIGYDFIPNTVMKEEDSVIAEENAQNQEETLTDSDILDAEAENLSFEDTALNFKTNFGDLEIEMLDEAAPRNVENIIRLASRDYYDGLAFHRIVKQDNFSVLQGGDPSGDGTGGESAFGVDVEDEIYTVAPEFETVDGETVISNTPEFTSDLYGQLDSETGQITYQKGLMIMANRGPNTNSSQFFLTLEDTVLQPSYTIVGTVNESNFDVLDTIREDINPIDQSGNVVEDGRPSKPVTIDDVEIVS